MKLNLYVTSFDAPAQFQLLLQSLRTAEPRLLDDTRKFLINNSTDPSTFAEYRDLCARHGFEELKRNNIGIAGARRLAAEHFAASDAQRMFFFQDDMLLHSAEASFCRRGFRQYTAGLLQKSLAIFDAEELDLLKLCFTEVFGDNSEQWAWTNVSLPVRQREFPEQPELVHGLRPPPTRFHRIGFHEGIGYALGEVYYSDWPHLISRAASARLFLDQPSEHATEHAWMARSFELARRGQLRSGVLLMSPVNHSRVHDYDIAKRLQHGERDAHGNRRIRMIDFQHVDWVAKATFQSFGVQYQLRVNRRELLAPAIERLPPGTRQIDSDDKQTVVFSLFHSPDFEERIAGTRGMTDFLFGAEASDLCDALESRVKIHVAENARSELFLHAGVVGWQGRAILLPGPSHAGKSTLVEALLRAGADYLSDDYAIIDQHGRIHPYPAPLSLRRTEGGVDRVRVATTTSEPLRPGLIAFAPYESGARFEPIPLSAGKAVIALLDNTLNARHQPDQALRILSTLVTQAERVLRSPRGEADSTAQSLLMQRW